jgi:uncharacterized repeat protein (TIGR03803 family)
LWKLRLWHGFQADATPKGQNTWTETVLHSFQGSDGSSHYAGLIADNQCALYGTTFGDGSSGKGTVFKLTRPAKGQTTWTETRAS